MALNKDFLMGFLSGTVVGAVGYRLYEQNSGQLQRLVQPKGAFSQNAAFLSTFCRGISSSKRTFRRYDC